MSNEILNQSTPKKINKNIKLIIESLGLDIGTVESLKLRKQTSFNAIEGSCHINCIKKNEIHGGAIQFGWVIWHDSKNCFTEAEFHSVWVNEKGELEDITPRVDNEKRVMFIPDFNRVPQLFDNGNSTNIKFYSNHKVSHEAVVLTTKLIERTLENDKLALIGF